MPETAPYGTWKSPITSDLIVAGTIGLNSVMLDGADIYWTESRPAEAGRSVVVRRTADGRIEDVTPAPFNVRTRVHEYGGGAYFVADGTVYFSNFADNRLYRQVPGAVPEPITTSSDLRYADGTIDRQRGHLIYVREDHSVPDREAVNTLVTMGLDGSNERVIVSGNDFYSNPSLSPDGTKLSWLTWNHPDMPWDGTELWVAPLGPDGALGRPERVAGGREESLFQPEWSPDGVLHVVSDRSGWWNLYRIRDGQMEALCPMDAEFGVPQWVFNQSTYAFVDPTHLICTYSGNGIGRLALLDTSTGRLEAIDSSYTAFSAIRAGRDYAACCAGSPTQHPAIVRIDLATRRFEVLRQSSDLTIDDGYLSVPEAIEFPTEHGLTAHAFYYAPRNRGFTAPQGERPPLLVKSHGGPTGSTSNTFNLGIQYWTSRGFAVLDVNYGGSTGYGRAYRQRLNGQWGIVDIDDCVNGARYLVEQGLVDGNRLTIDGGSAGGYTTLSVLTFKDAFAAGASYYGVSDVEALATDTHKFESRYLDSMIGPYPERRDLYVERSPIHFTDRLSRPLILFQGLDDKVVLPNQAELMYEAVRAKGIPVAYIPFEGEGHGFRRAENIKRALDAEFYFYARVFGYTPADATEPVPIANM